MAVNEGVGPFLGIDRCEPHMEGPQHLLPSHPLPEPRKEARFVLLIIPREGGSESWGVSQLHSTWETMKLVHLPGAESTNVWDTCACARHKQMHPGSNCCSRNRPLLVIPTDGFHKSRLTRSFQMARLDYDQEKAMQHFMRLNLHQIEHP